jgi:hypothetical protein
LGNNDEESLIAVGLNSIKIPILQINTNNIKGTILNTIDGKVIKYF